MVGKNTLVSVTLAAALGALPVGRAYAAPMSPADRAARTVAADDARQRVAHVASRAEVREQLVKLGVSPEEAQQRLAALSDDEVKALDGKLAALPAGGDSTITIGVGSAIIIALLLIIFL